MGREGVTREPITTFALMSQGHIVGFGVGSAFGMELGIDIHVTRKQSCLALSKFYFQTSCKLRFYSTIRLAVCTQDGTATLKNDVTATWKDTFYSGEDERAIAAKKKQNQDREHDTRRHENEARHLPDAFDMLMTLPYIMVTRNEL
ncbi:hypothetical protein FIBSPDRAFT_980848 [Athelia psychrophila]|uniref:Uncharacterized protein n=1 Tax=Athelia psychrophila TaxID=1759441 RepID=A0A166D3X3_9AGAM|nr:hypothetical protein FIBSPDRAFT_980848 [Fibularhizoctonia sp. CBS 109695]